MKVSPVVGIPTIPQPNSTGLSSEKIARLKAIASGQEPAAAGEAPAPEPQVVEQKTPPSNTVIKMKTRDESAGDVAALQEALATPEAEPEKGISDTSVQTNPVPEAIQQVSPQIAALAKEKRALQVMKSELEAERKALEAQKAPNEWAEREKRMKSGQALSVLQELGVTYDQLTNEILGKQNAPDFTGIKEEILKGVDERIAAKDVAQEEAVFEHMSKNVNRMSFTTEDYPFIKRGKAQEKVMDLIKRTWREEGEALDEEEAMRLIEVELKEDAKVYAGLLKEPEPTTQATPQPAANKKQEIKTLTNKDSARPLSSRRQRALAAFLGQHK